jgi:hypothetical protein
MWMGQARWCHPGDPRSGAVLEATLRGAGLPVVRRYGTRFANDPLTSNDLKCDEAYFEDLLTPELASIFRRCGVVA